MSKGEGLNLTLISGHQNHPNLYYNYPHHTLPLARLFDDLQHCTTRTENIAAIPREDVALNKTESLHLDDQIMSADYLALVLGIAQSCFCC